MLSHCLDAGKQKQKCAPLLSRRRTLQGHLSNPNPLHPKDLLRPPACLLLGSPSFQPFLLRIDHIFGALSSTAQPSFNQLPPPEVRSFASDWHKRIKPAAFITGQT